MTAPHGPEAGADPSEEDLYDAYVEAALGGDAQDPDEFLRARGASHATTVLRERLRAVHATTRGRAERSLPFDRLGDYRVLRQLDAGGMGTVLLGEEEGLGRLVALKLLRPELQSSPTLAARFEREAQVVARLRHPNIVTIYGVGEERGTRFVAMEYIEGDGLDTVIARSRETRERLPIETCVRWAIQIAGALQAAHEAGVVHRDVKPSNIRINSAGEAVLLDFGIASEEGASRLTATGRMLGTTAYAAPEQLRSSRDEDVDGRADVWALGVVLHEALTGEQPFDGDTDAAAIKNVLESDPRPLRRLRGEAPRDLETVLQVALEKSPERRYASAAGFAEDLRAVLAVRTVRGRRASPVRRAVRLARRHPALAVAALLVVAGVALAAAVQESRRQSEIADAFTAARANIAAFRDECEAAREAENELAWLDALVESHYMTPDEESRLRAAEDEVIASRRRREAAFHEALAKLSRADRLGAPEDEVSRVRGLLFVERWREARTRGDDADAGFYRNLAVERVGEDELPVDIVGTSTIEVRCATPGATARLFHDVLLTDLDPSAEPRLAPIPLLAENPLEPGAWAFRLLADHGELEAGDLVLAVRGETPNESTWRDLQAQLEAGADVRVHGREVHGTVTVPPDAHVRITTRPLGWPTDGEVLGRGPVSVPTGGVSVVVRAPGHEEARLSLNLWNQDAPLVDVSLRPVGTTPPGFVHVRPTTPGVDDFWVGETEVTAEQYFAFLNDPATQAEIEASDVLIRVPRSPTTTAAGGHPHRGADGRYVLPSSWSPDWPIIGVSWDDAVAYCAWWTRRSGASGAPFVARLPTKEQWDAAAGYVATKYVFGNRFHPKWVSSCFALPRATPAPVMSFPRDETASGLFDTAGSVFEWMDVWWDETDGERRLLGGSWARATRDTFNVHGGQGSRPERATDETGFRVVLVEPTE